MLHLRLIVPPDRVDAVLRLLATDPSVTDLCRIPGGALRPAGDVVTADVAREAADTLLDGLRDLGVERDGAVAFETTTTVGAAAARAEAAAPGHGDDALVWEEVEARAVAESRTTVSYLVFMAAAGVIAAAGLLTDSPVLIVGAMVVSPDFGPLASLCVALVGRRSLVAPAVVTLVAGLVAAAVAALATGLVARGAGLLPDDHDLAARTLTAFVSEPDAFAVMVGLAAGVVGMLSLTEGKAGALVGVLISVTTIPAAADLGVGVASTSADEVAGAGAQLAINVACLVAAGVATLAAQRALSARFHRRLHVPRSLQR